MTATHLNHHAIIIVLNGARFLPLCVYSIQDFFEHIWIIEGAEKPSAWLATREGTSIDNTLLSLAKILGIKTAKITYIQKGLVEDKVDLCNEPLERLAQGDWTNPDYIWEIDSDEFYELEDLYEMDRILYNHRYEAIEVKPYNFFHTLDCIGKNSRWEEWFRRIWAYRPGCRFASHRPPAMDYKPYNEMDVLKSNIPLYHLSYVDPFQVKFRCLSHALRGYDLLDWYDYNWRRFAVDHDVDTHPTSQLVNEKGSYASFDTTQLPLYLQKLNAQSFSKINILHILPTLSGGGACRACLELIRAGNPSVLNQRLYVEGAQHPQMVNYDDIPMDGNLDLKKYDIVNVHWWHDMDAVFDKIRTAKNIKPDLKVVITSHIFNRPEYKLDTFKRWDFTKSEVELADKIVWATDKYWKIFKEETPFNKYILGNSIHIPLGTDLMRFAFEARNKPAHDTLNVGIPGVYYRLKIVENAVDILKQIDLPNIRFHMLSWGGEYHDRFREQTAGDERFVWFGYQKHLPDWLRNLDWVIGMYPRQTSCSSELQLQETMAMKIPVLITVPESMVDLVIDGKTGFVAPAPEAIPDYFKMLVTKPWQSIVETAIENAFVNVLENFGADNAIRQYEELYRELLNEPIH